MRYHKKCHVSNKFSKQNLFSFDKKTIWFKRRRKPDHSNNNNGEGCLYNLGNRSAIGFGIERTRNRGNVHGNYEYEENDDDEDGNRSRSRIKFTRKFTYQYKSFCCILSSLLISLLSAAVVFYSGYQIIKLEPGEEILFHGSFIVKQEEFHHSSSSSFNISLRKPETKFNYYAEVIEAAFINHPIFRLALLSTEILAVDGENEDRNVTVHFEMKFNPKLLLGTNVNDLLSILKRNLQVSRGIVEKNSISLHEVYLSSTVSSHTPLSYSHILEENFSDYFRKCVPALELPFCPNISRNRQTTFPNIFMHHNKEDIQQDLIIFRELIDSECFENSAEFLCEILQPDCSHHKKLYEIPCRSFCNEFLNNCGERFSKRLRKYLDCSKFPEYSNVGKNCRTQPNCNTATLKNDNTFSYRLCDGVIDCSELEDEISCPYCSGENSIHCGLSKKCIHRISRCNGVVDCPDGSDEENCLFLTSQIESEFQYRTVLDVYSYQKGYVAYINEGIIANICVDKDLSSVSTTLLSEKIGQPLCNSFSYKNVSEIETKLMITNVSSHLKSYFNLKYNEESEMFSFLLNSTCSTHQGLYIACGDIECGIKITKPYGNNIDNLNKIASAGDWPWHVLLFKNGVHSCDATLLSQNWLISTVSCFQGQNKAEWTAKLGTVRLYGKPPWQQERHIIGMVKSPVEGSTLVLLKLNNPVIYSHFVRPICLPTDQSSEENFLYCNTLGWTKTRKMLQRIEIKETSMENCSDMSITSDNGLCAASTFETTECNEEEMSGSAMFCLTAEQKTWVLVGISNWKMSSCSQIEIQRPRLYDKVKTSVNWIQNIIQEI